MSLVAVGLLKVLIVEGLNCAVLVGLTEIHLRVCLVKNRSAKLTEIYVVVNNCGLSGLTTTVYATAGTSHDLDKVNLGLAALNAVEERLSVCGTGCNCNANGNVTKLVGCLLNACDTANVVEFKLFKLFAEYGELLP